VIGAADGVQGLVRIGIDGLCRVPGVEESRAARLKAAVELGRHLVGDREERPQMLSTADIVDADAAVCRLVSSGLA
jgi:DNA repair protein RadC